MVDMAFSWSKVHHKTQISLHRVNTIHYRILNVNYLTAQQINIFLLIKY